MRCLKPVKVPLSDENQRKRLENHELPPELRLATYIYVPCGKCEACLVKKRMDWFFRLKSELEDSSSCYFITLTYDDNHVPWHHYYDDDNKEMRICMSVKKDDVQRFIKRLRDHYKGYPIRYFLVSEYGSKTLRPHYHCIIFNLPNNDNHFDDHVAAIWKQGFVTVAPITDNRINYVCSYCLDKSTLPKHLPPNFMLSSRRPGIGAQFLDHLNRCRYLVDRKTDKYYLNSGSGSTCYRLPRYLADKLFADDVKQQITCEYIKEHLQSYKQELSQQVLWLKDHNINSFDPFVPYPNSPLYQKQLEKEEFKKKIRSKCKNKGNI